MFIFAKDMPFMESAILQIGDILVSTEIVTEYFCCDYETCRGACCVVGDSGAPLAEGESEALERDYPAYAPLLTEAARARISEVGFFEIDRDGDCVTPLLGHSEECVYTRFEPTPTAAATTDTPAAHASASDAATTGTPAADASGVSLCSDEKVLAARAPLGDSSAASSGPVPAGKSCFCAIERAHIAGRCRFVKPISCRLYPIRASRLSNGLIALNLHRWYICRCAFEKGRREGVRVYEFLREPLIAAYGADFYEALSAYAQNILTR
jgi:hypothetical protein